MAIEQGLFVPRQSPDSSKSKLFKSVTHVSGLVVASDGVKRHMPIDVINTPFYGGWKILLKDKILNQQITTSEGQPLVEPVIRAMFDSSAVSDFVVVGNKDQCEYLDNLASKNSNGKPYKVVENKGHIGEAIALGADNIVSPGYIFAVMPDLPYANGKAIDFAVADILKIQNLGSDIYLPIIQSDLFLKHGENWQRKFRTLRNGETSGQFTVLNFVIVSSRTINPDAIKKYYDIRQISSLKGKVNAARYFPALLPEVALSYLAKKLSISNLEEMGSELYKGELKVLVVSDPIYMSFMKDIDTLGDYRAYKMDEGNNGRSRNG